jgi:hypothetical protein
MRIIHRRPLWPLAHVPGAVVAAPSSLTIMKLHDLVRLCTILDVSHAVFFLRPCLAVHGEVAGTSLPRRLNNRRRTRLGVGDVHNGGSMWGFMVGLQLGDVGG